MKKSTLTFIAAEAITAGVILAYGFYMDKWKDAEMVKVREYMHEHYLKNTSTNEKYKVEGAQDVVNLIFKRLLTARTKKCFNFYFDLLKEYNVKLKETFMSGNPEQKQAVIIAEYWSVLSRFNSN